MTTIDGYFSQRPMPSNIVIVEDEDEDGESQQTNIPDQSTQKRSRRRLSISEHSEISEIESLPPEYESRRPSASYEGLEERQALFMPQAGSSSLQAPPTFLPRDIPPHQQIQQHELRRDCDCGEPQCIPCSIAGRRRGDSRSWTKRSPRRIFRFTCSGLFLILLMWLLVATWNLRKIYRDIDPIDGGGDDISSPDERMHICGHEKPKVQESYKFNIPFSASSHSFTFEQLVTDRPIDLTNIRRQVYVTGGVVVRNALDIDEVPKNEIKVLLDLKMTDETLRDELHVEAKEGRVLLKAPRTLPDDSRPPACIIVDAVVIFPHPHFESKLEDFNILTETLSVKIEQNIDFDVTKAHIRTIASHIFSDMDAKGHGMNAVNLEVSSISGAIKGVWGIGEKVSWQTKSGAINIGLFPLEPENSDSVTIDVHTVSGAVSVHAVENSMRYPFHEHVKSFKTEVSTYSGAITGQFTLGSLLKFSTISGRITADVLPIAPDMGDSHERTKSYFSTDTKSGRTVIHFLDRQKKTTTFASKIHSGLEKGQSTIKWVLQEKRRLIQYFKNKCPSKKSHADMGIMTQTGNETVAVTTLLTSRSEKELVPVIVATHRSISGGVKLHYPELFEGDIYAKSLTGSVHVEGEGVKIVRRVKRPRIGHEVEAVKGNATGGKIEMDSVSGGVFLMIGG